MDRLNYHHLRYFFTVAREGSIARASASLGVSQPTVSAQIHELEDELERKLLERSGRGLKLTSAGETVLRYASSIFALGGNLLAALKGDLAAEPELSGGIASSLPQPLIATLICELLRSGSRPRLTLHDGTCEALAAKVAAGELQFAITDSFATSAAVRRVHRRVLLQCTVALFAAPALARKLRRGFPSRPGTLRVIMPADGALREEVERWLRRERITVEAVAEAPNPEFYASAAGAAIFAPSLQREWLRNTHGLMTAGELKGSRWRAFLLTPTATKLSALEPLLAAARRLG